MQTLSLHRSFWFSLSDYMFHIAKYLQTLKLSDTHSLCALVRYFKPLPSLESIPIASIQIASIYFIWLHIVMTIHFTLLNEWMKNTFAVSVQHSTAFGNIVFEFKLTFAEDEVTWKFVYHFSQNLWITYSQVQLNYFRSCSTCLRV